MRAILLALALTAFPLFAVEKPAPPSDLTSPPADAERFDDGLVTKTLVAGSGDARLTDENIARVRVTVWKSDGTLVQHVPHGDALMITADKMIPGWAEAVKKMSVGESRRAWIPSTLGGGKIAEGQSLVIDTDLVELLDRPTTPVDVGAPPADAITTPSGLAYKVLHAGTGTTHPTRRSTVVVHYTGWTTDGKMFDSSLLRGTTAEFPMDGVIRGWIEGLQLMVAGEKTRFWIPSKLAYGRDKTKPQGMLVFDIDLVSFR